MLRLEIEQDTWSLSPREENNLGTIYYQEGSRFAFGDEALSKGELRRIEEDESLYSLPVYAYVHGDEIALNTTGFSCPWDSGRCGIIAASKKRAEEYLQSVWDYEEEEITPELVYDTLRVEVKEFSMYLNGDVIGWIIYDGEEYLQSVWGYYDLTNCKEEGERFLAYWQERRAREIALIHQEEIGELI